MKLFSLLLATALLSPVAALASPGDDGCVGNCRGEGGGIGDVSSTNRNSNTNRNTNSNRSVNRNTNSNRSTNRNTNNNANRNTNNNTNRQGQAQGQLQGQAQGQGQRQSATAVSGSRSNSNAQGGAGGSSTASNSGNSQSINIQSGGDYYAAEAAVAPLPVPGVPGQIGDVVVPLPSVGIGVFGSRDEVPGFGGQRNTYGAGVGFHIPLGTARFNEWAEAEAANRANKAKFRLIQEAVWLRERGVLTEDAHPRHWQALYGDAAIHPVR